MDILQKIAIHKFEEVKLRKEQVSVKQLEQSHFFNTETLSLRKHILDKTNAGVIAEFKRRSPSKPAINLSANVINITIGYEKSGASALSILTDGTFFGGSLSDLQQAREKVNIPILRKDFIIDEYQIIEAKSIGASAILLISEILSEEKIKGFTELAHSINLEVLLELHDESMLHKTHHSIDLLGINNRNLKTFEVSINTSIEIASQIGNDFTLISESGIKSIDDILQLKSAGFEGFLIGELFMKQSNPIELCALLCKQILIN